MARERKPIYTPTDSQQEEMTVIVVKFKGGPESMQKGFDSVNNAIAALGPAQSNNHRITVQRAPAHIAPPANSDQVIDTELQDLESAEIEESVTETLAVPATPPKPRKAYNFMNDFNLTPTGVPSLKDYCVQKNPQTDNDKFLVASAWIQQHGGADPFTGRHLFTAFRAMQWDTQVDMTQPMRTMKLKKSYFENPSTGKWKLTVIGLEAAEAIGK